MSMFSDALRAASRAAARDLEPLRRALMKMKSDRPKRLPKPTSKFEVHECDPCKLNIHRMNSLKAAQRLIKGLFLSYATVDATTPEIKLVQIAKGRRKVIEHFPKGANL